MNYTYLGNTGLRVSKYCFGSLTLGPLGAALPLDQGVNILKTAFDRGINFIDTAEYYQNYDYIYQALASFDNPDNIVITSKTLSDSDTGAAAAIEEARIKLKRNKLDIFLLHEIRDEQDFNDRHGAWQTLVNAKKNNCITAIGISTHSAAVTAWAAQQDDIDIVHCMLNISGIGILDGDVNDMLQAINHLHAAEKGIYTMKALGGGALMHTAREALTWAFSQKNIHSVAVGCKDTAELLTNLSWIKGEESEEAAKINYIDRNIVFDKSPQCHGCRACVDICANGAMKMNEDNMAYWDKSKCLYCGYCIAACPWFCIEFC